MAKITQADVHINAKDKTKTAFNSVQGRLKRLKDSLTGLKGAMTLVTAVGFVTMAKEAAKSADAIGKFADRAGVTTSELQKMRFAFDLAGVGVEAVDKAFLTFGKRLGKARQGIGALQGGLKGGEEALLEKLKATNNVSEALNVMFKAMGEAESQTRKLAIADAAFGDAGLRMTAAFRDGSDAFFAAKKRAEELGLVIDERLIRNAEKMNDELTVTSEVLKLQFATAFLQAAPAITATAQATTELVTSLRPFFKELSTHKEELKIFLGAMTGLVIGAKVASVLPGKQLKILVPLLTAAGGAFLGMGEDAEGAANGLEKVQKQAQKVNKDVEVLADGINVKMKKAFQPFEEPSRPTPFFNLGSGVIDTSELEKSKSVFNDLQTSLREMRDIEYKRAESIQAEINGYPEIIRLREAHKEIERQINEFAKEQNLTESHKHALLQEGFKMQTKAFEASEKAQKQLEEHNKMLQRNAQLANIASNVFDRFGDGILFSMQRGQSAIESFRDSAVAALFDVQRELFKILVFQPFKNALIGFASDAFGFQLPKGYGGGRASGGMVEGGKSYMVGERGMEMFTPATNGYITPNDQLGGGGVNVTLNFTTGIQSTVRAEIMGLMPVISENVKQAVSDSRQRGGSFSKAMMGA